LRSPRRLHGDQRNGQRSDLAQPARRYDLRGVLHDDEESGGCSEGIAKVAQGRGRKSEAAGERRMDRHQHERRRNRRGECDGIRPSLLRGIHGSPIAPGEEIEEVHGKEGDWEIAKPERKGNAKREQARKCPGKGDLEDSDKIRPVKTDNVVNKDKLAKCRHHDIHEVKAET
jgi:hypothetical protein